MKILKVLLLSMLFSLTQVSLAEDYVDLLNLSNYKEGDAVPALGENLAVGLVEKTGEKYITVLEDSNGKLIVPVNLSGDFEILMKMKPRSNMEMFIVPSDNESQSKVKLDSSFYSNNYHLFLTGSFERQDVVWNTSSIDNYKLLISGSMAKLYVNDLYLEKSKLANPDSTIYTGLLMNGIDSDFQLYELKVRNLSGTSPVNSDNNYEAGKQAGIQQCMSNPSSCGISISGTPATTDGCVANYSANGELHLPCVNVPGAFGKIDTYEVWLQQQSGSFTFDLDLTRIQLK